MSKIITVTGEIQSNEMGLTLPHEHILVDFIGADKSGKHRYDSEAVIKVMLPYLLEIKDLDVKTFVDCTPMYLARDIKILKDLSLQTGLFILTNTGIYGREPYIPHYAYNSKPDELAHQWIKEFNEGIEETDIRPGFIKTAVEAGKFTDIEKKLIEAAAITSKETDLTIATHTCFGEKALQILNVLNDYEVDPRKWIFVHANIEEKIELISQVAERGAWISLDGIGQGQDDNILRILETLLEQDFLSQILLSQDAGCYFVGEEEGGNIRSFGFLFTDFLPKLQERGISEEIIHELTYTNPAKAYSI